MNYGQTSGLKAGDLVRVKRRGNAVGIVCLFVARVGNEIRVLTEDNEEIEVAAECLLHKG